MLVETLTHTPHKHAVGAEFVECKVSTYARDTFTCGRMRGARVRTCVRAYVRACVSAYSEDARPAEASMLTAFS